MPFASTENPAALSQSLAGPQRLLDGRTGDGNGACTAGLQSSGDQSTAILKSGGVSEPLNSACKVQRKALCGYQRIRDLRRTTRNMAPKVG